MNELFGWLDLYSKNIIEPKPLNAVNCISFLIFHYNIQCFIFAIYLHDDRVLNLLIYVFHFGKYLDKITNVCSWESLFYASRWYRSVYDLIHSHFACFKNANHTE